MLALQAAAQQSGLAEDAQRANDFANQCQRFEKKLHDLELTRVICLQMAPQIRMIQNNDTLMSEKIQTSLVNTIPLWKSQMVLALGLSHAQKAMEAQRQVTDMTNTLLKKNADMLKTASVETAKESERGRGRSGDAAAHEPEPDRDAGRGPADPDRGRPEARRPPRRSCARSKASSSRSCWRSAAAIARRKRIYSSGPLRRAGAAVLLCAAVLARWEEEA